MPGGGGYTRSDLRARATRFDGSTTSCTRHTSIRWFITERMFFSWDEEKLRGEGTKGGTRQTDAYLHEIVDLEEQCLVDVKRFGPVEVRRHVVTGLEGACRSSKMVSLLSVRRKLSPRTGCGRD